MGFRWAEGTRKVKTGGCKGRSTMPEGWERGVGRGNSPLSLRYLRTCPCSCLNLSRRLLRSLCERRLPRYERESNESRSGAGGAERDDGGCQLSNCRQLLQRMLIREDAYPIDGPAGKGRTLVSKMIQAREQDSRERERRTSCARGGSALGCAGGCWGSCHRWWWRWGVHDDDIV